MRADASCPVKKEPGACRGGSYATGGREDYIDSMLIKCDHLMKANDS